MIKILSFPSRHPYMAKFHKKGGLEFVNPNTDYFNNHGGCAEINYIKNTHPVESYDLVHIHFSFDKLPIDKLESLLDYFIENNKPIIWTCHSKESQREKDIEKGKYQKLLYQKASKIITLTNGCRNWIINNLGKDKEIIVIPHGYIIDPNSMAKYKKDSRKKRKENFIFLVGELRENKEVVQTIINFLQCSELKKCTLTVLVKPISAYAENGFRKFNIRNLIFWNLINSSPRIKSVSLPEISNELLYSHFFRSHVCILPYLWGTHSGQVELACDSLCQVVISDVGFYKEQSNQIVEYKFDENPSVLASNFTKALIEAYNLPLLRFSHIDREQEFQQILKAHIKVYERHLGKN